MNMHWVDWSVVAVLMAVVTVMAAVTKRYTRSVADFLAASRTAGRYVITVSEGAAALGAITVVATYEKIYQAGFTAMWWDVPVLAIGFFAALAGWVIYRFRQSRAMTMAQFFEMRYSRRFRVFAGLLAFVAGIVNFGIFPAVGARFFIYFCGLPATFPIGPLEVSTFVTIMILLLGISLLFTLLGGQIAVIVTDFVQGLFSMFVFVILFLVLRSRFGWSQIQAAIASAPADASLANPFKTHNIEGFDIYFFLIAMIGAFYMTMSWQGTQGYNCSARTPHEAKMGKVLGMWRYTILGLLILSMPICAYTFLNNPEFAGQAAEVQETLNRIDGDQIQKQMQVPVALSAMLPVGAMGGLCAVMLAAFISTHDSYLHSWGSIFIQDVVLPFRKKRLTPKQHLLLLRLSTCGVAVFIFFFSLLFRQTEYIFMFFAITGAIFLGGSGSVIIGGLYWKRGTTAGAWATMLVGSTLAVTGIVIRQPGPAGFLRTLQLSPGWQRAIEYVLALDGQRMFFFAMTAAVITYVVVSLLSRRPAVDLDRILHRGRYAVAGDTVTADGRRAFGWRALMMGREFTRGDKTIYVGFLIWLVGWLAVFVFGIIYNLVTDVPTESWLKFWHYYLWMALILGAATTVWFAIGGVRDLKDMFRRLRETVPDDFDDGQMVPGDHRA
ncbi:MAG: sodium:solute symporter [bacterium]|nr:sodium:solute symporter [bacterium]